MERNPIELSIYRDEPGFFCPAAFWPAFGYDNDARFVGIWWDAATDEACWYDGRSGYIGAEPTAYHLLLERNFPPGHPAHWLLGTCATPATMWLVVARASGRASLVAADDGPMLLAALNGYDATEVTAADALDVVSPELPVTPAVRRWTPRGAWLEPALSPQALAEAIAQSSVRHEALAAALAGTPLALNAEAQDAQGGQPRLRHAPALPS